MTRDPRRYRATKSLLLMPKFNALIVGAGRDLHEVTTNTEAKPAGRAAFHSAIWACTSCVAFTSGCYAGVGPTLSFVNRGPVAVGWEASGLTGTVGGSYALGQRGERPWRTRMFLAWEPRIGVPLAGSDWADANGVGFAGLGGTLGAHWDTHDGVDAPPKAQFLGGLWVGGGYVFPAGKDSSSCDDTLHPYLSFAVGMRGGEMYLAPKVGVLDVPSFCVSAGF